MESNLKRKFSEGPADSSSSSAPTSEARDSMSGHLRCHNGKHLTKDRKEELMCTVSNLCKRRGLGITACDESAGTIGARFENVSIENTEENRRVYRQMLFTSGSKELSGAILDPETLTQLSDSAVLFPELLYNNKIVTGVKPHLKTYTLPGTGDTVMQGLDSLAVRLSTYYKQGARFAKWRAPFVVDVAAGNPTRLAIEANMNDLARFALISQSEGLVPMVEPDVTMPGDHTLEQAVAINTEILGVLFQAMREQGVYLEGCVLKTNMINPGKQCPVKYSLEQIAAANLDVLAQTVPACIRGVFYLSGGQDIDRVCDILDCINKMKQVVNESRPQYPWNTTFSWSAAIQLPLLKLCVTDDGVKNRKLAEALPEMKKKYLHILNKAGTAALGNMEVCD